MSSVTTSPPLSHEIRRLLDQVRGRIRSYVWLDGAARVALVIGAAFWLTLGFDYWVEPPVWVRVSMLLLTAAGLGWVLYRYLITRAATPLSDASMAVVLERRFRNFGDSLITSVELGAQPNIAGQYNSEMLAYTRELAEQSAGRATVNDVFQWGPLGLRLAAALGLLASIAALAIFAPGVFELWFKRSVLQSNQLWPRRTVLEVEGFESGPIKVGKGGDLTVLVKAETDWENPDRKVPDTVQMRYTAADEGKQKRELMKREREAIVPQDHYQYFRYQFSAINSDIKFYVVGGDGRSEEYFIKVVENPAITGATIDCEYPAYFNRAPALGVPVASRKQWPQGSRITISAAVNNKPLKQVLVERLEGMKQIPVSNPPLVITEDRLHFIYVIDGLGLDQDRLGRDEVIQFNLLDTDGIKTRTPYRLTLAVVPDEPPRVETRFRSIGTAITPNARLPIKGKISDDIGLSRIWFEHQVMDGKQGALGAAVPTPFVRKIVNQQELSFDPPAAEAKTGTPDAGVEEALDVKELGLKIGTQLAVSVKAEDHCNLVSRGSAGEPSGPPANDQPALTGKPNVGVSERYQLDVVTPEALRSLLEARELKLRRQFETILGEMTDTRDSLGRIKFVAAPEIKAGPKPGDEPEEAGGKKPAGLEPGDVAKSPEGAASSAATRFLRMQRGVANCQRSSHENLSLAAEFDDLRDELINNRIDTEELRQRLGEKIIRPLQLLAQRSIPEFERRLRDAAAVNADLAAGSAALDKAKDQGDKVLREMDQILKNMLELEDYNQLVETLRQIVELQERVNAQTLQQQKERAKRLLEEN